MSRNRWRLLAPGLIGIAALAAMGWMAAPSARLWRVRRYDLQHLERLSAQSPRDWMAHLVLAEELEQSGDFIHALQAYHQALSVEPRKTEALTGLARVSLSLGEVPLRLRPVPRPSR